MAYTLKIKIVVPHRFYQEAIIMSLSEKCDSLDDFFNIFTGVVGESFPKGVRTTVQYNQSNSRAGGHIYQLTGETDREENFHAFFGNKQVIRLLELITPYSAHGAICIEKGGRKVGSYEIGYGHSHRVYIHLPKEVAQGVADITIEDIMSSGSSTTSYTDASSSSSSSSYNETPKRKSHDEDEDYCPGAPKKKRSGLTIEGLRMQTLGQSERLNFTQNLGPKCAIDYLDSALFISIIVPPKHMTDATRAVQEKGYGTVESYFNALSHMIVCTKKETTYNEVSRKNGAYIFVMTLRSMYDNFVYIFNSKVKEMFELISPFCNKNTMAVKTPIEQVDGTITYEDSPIYKLTVGPDYECYMGEDEETFFGSNPVANPDIFANASASEATRSSSPTLEQFKTDNHDILNKIHTRYEQLIGKMEDLRHERDNYNIEIEITRRIIKELEELI